MADFVKKVGNKLRLRVSVYDLCAKFFSEIRPIFHIFKSAKVVETVRLGGTPTLVLL
jgi:hypothetical protein